MSKISLHTYNDIGVNESGQLEIKVSPDDGNALGILADGLYVENLGTNSKGFVDQSSGNMIRIGFKGAYDFLNSDGSYPQPGRVSATNTVHHFYTMESESGPIQGFRKDLDYVLPGDLIRVNKGDGKYEYRLVTDVTVSSDTNSSQYEGNAVRNYVVLGTW